MKTMLTKMMKIAAAITVAAGATLSVYAEAVTDTNDVTAVVVGWQRAQEALGEQLTAAPASVREYSGLGGTGTYYVVSLEGGGYVVTSGDTSLEPVLAYSKTGTWVDDVKRNPLMAMLEFDIAAAAALETASVQQQGDDAAPQTGGRRLAATASVQQQEGAADTMATQREANATKWAKYKAGASQKGGKRLQASEPTSDLRVPALVKSAWNQSTQTIYYKSTWGNSSTTVNLYNYYTPNNYVCGCVATMMSQIMRYWEWPKGTNITAIANYNGYVRYGSGDSETLTSSDLESGYYASATATTKTKWTANSRPAFGGTYDWANMPTNFSTFVASSSSAISTVQAAIGKLTRDCGIACFMKYSSGGSGAPMVCAHRLVHQFAYANAKLTEGGWTDANRDALLSNLDAGLPCGMEVPGHAIVADGYGYDNSGTLFVHFNMGWGSIGSDTWYTPPSSIGQFTGVNNIIYNIYPPSKGAPELTIVSGRVLNGTTPKSGVTVTATNRDTGFSTNVTSNAKGIYYFMLPHGFYSFSATSGGSSAKVERQVKLCMSDHIKSSASGYSYSTTIGVPGNIHGLDLKLGTAVTAPSVALTHRWSFNDNLNDSVGSSNASKIGSNVNLVDGKAVCTGNGAGQGSLNLGANLLNTDGATIEIWAANDEVKNGSRIFEYGVDTGHYFMMAWTKSTDLYVDCAEAFSDGANNIYDGALAPFTLGRQYHISVTFERQGDGTTKVRATRRDAASGAIQRVAVYSVTNGIHTFSSPILRLGRSFQGNVDARATYDEVRVWNGVLSDAQLKASALAGPDANLSTLPWNASAVRYVAKAVWQGGATAPTAASLANSANWSCTDQNGDAITGVPEARSLVIIPNGTTAFTIPEGYTPAWRKMRIGSEGAAATKRARKAPVSNDYAAQYNAELLAYTDSVEAPPDALARNVVLDTVDEPAELAAAQLRYDGWVNVPAGQAGRWTFFAYADDYAGIGIDGEWIAYLHAMDDGLRSASADVSAGWHRFTIIVGDTGGGYGGCILAGDQTCLAPIVVSVNGALSQPFTSSHFTFGAPDGTASAVTLAGDADWSSIGEVTLDSGAELDLNGHTLTIDKMDSSFLGANIKDTSATPGTIKFAEGGAVNSGNITVQSNVKKAYANAEELITAEAAFWLDASDVSTITTNASGEVTQWNSRVGSNYATQGRNYFAGSAFLYPTYDATTYGIPTVDFGNAVQSGWDNSNPGRDLNINTPVAVKTVFFVTRIQNDGKAAWLGQEDAAAGTGNCFRRDEYGAYNDKRSGQPGQSRFANFWIGTDVVADMTTEYPPEGNFCVFSAQMDDAGTYAAQHLAEQCGGLHSGGKQLSELIVFNRILSDEERTEVTQYLQTKWFGERSVFDDAIFWLDASDVSTITTNASGEVTRWNSRVGSNYATQGRNYYAGSAFQYPTYDATTYGIPTVDFGNAVQSGWDNSNPGRDLNINTPVVVKTMFFVTRIQKDGKAAWLGQEDAAAGTGNCFRRDEYGAYNDKRSGQPGQSRFANFWIGTDVVADMTTEYPPEDKFCVYSAQMDDAGTYEAQHLAEQCGGLHSGGKQLSELIIFNRALSDEERTEVTRYLQMKWLVPHATLTHRWSFNGSTDAENLTDSVGGVVAKKRYKSSNTTTVDGGTVTWSDGKAITSGGDGGGHLNMGTGILGTGDAATIELWVTKLSKPTAWSYIFSYNKPDVANCLTFATSMGSDNSRTKFEAGGVSGSTTGQENAMIPQPVGVTYHYSVTFQSNGSGGTVVRWMTRNAETGGLLSEFTHTVNSWTLASAAANEWALTLACNPWVNGRHNVNAAWDEVRVWDGVLSDEQLTANVLAGPNATLGGGTRDVLIGDGETFVVPTVGGYGYKTDSAVALGAGTKIRFDTTGYFGKGLRFKTGGFVLPSGSVLDYVELSDTANYAATMEDVNTILVQLKSTIPYESTWIGGTPSTAADLSNTANWASTNAQGSAISAVPAAKTTVIIPTALLPTFTIPDGATVNCGRALLGGHTKAKYGFKDGSPDNAYTTWRDLAFSDYTTVSDIPNGKNDISYFNGTKDTPGTPSEMGTAQIRIDGWFYVTAAQAGKWKFPNFNDDVASFAIDGVWLYLNNTYRQQANSGCFVSEGWHRYTLAIGDTGGGWGARLKVESIWVPVAVSINGASNIAFTDANFTFGNDADTVTLSQDCDWRALGDIDVSGGLTIDLNGHALAVTDIGRSSLGASIVNNSETSSSVYVNGVPSSSAAQTSGMASVPIMQYGAKSAIYTGGANDGGNALTPGNWTVRNGAGMTVSGGLPDSETPVIVSGDNVNLQIPAGSTFQCASLTIQDCTLTADCDWRGLAVTPSITGTADLNGYNLRLNHLTANANSALANSGAGVSGVMFDATAGGYNESSYVDGLSNLDTSENAHIIILNYPGDSVSALAIGNTANKWTEVRMANGTFSSSANPTAVDNVANAHGILTVDGATVTLNSLKVQGQNNIAGSGTVNVKSGNLTMTGWTDAGNGSGSATFNQSGGTVTSKGNFWVGRQNNGVATYNMTGGSTFTATGSWGLGVSTGKGYFNQSGGTLNLNSTSDSNGAFFGYDSSSVAKYVQTGGTVNAKPNVLLGRAGTGELDIGGSFTMNTAGKGVTMGSNGGTGTLTLREGGVLTTSFLKKGSGTAYATFDGGTIKAHDANNAGTFISGIGDVKYTAKGLTVDTNGKNVSMVNNTVTLAAPGSAVNKAGTGTLTVDALPPTDGVNVNAGTLALSANCDNTTSGLLAHRWSFNEADETANLTDAVDRTAVAEKIGSNIAFAGGEAVMSGNGNSTGSLNLGTGIFAGNDATIEIWATRTGTPNWARLFDYGSDTVNYMIFTWNYGTSTTRTQFIIRKAGSDKVGIDGNYFSNNVKYHIVVTVNANADGTSTVRMVRRNVADSSDVKQATFTSQADWTLANLSGCNFYLGHSQFSSDRDANAKYDEVRIWNAALNDEAIALSYAKGPNASDGDIAAIAAANSRTLAVASGATLDLGGHTLTQPRLAGAGTVQNGTLNVGTLAPGGDGMSGAIALNVSSVSGVIRIDNGDTFTTTTTGLDLSGATIDLATTPTRSFVVGTASGSGSFVAGRPALTVNGAPLKGWMVKRSGNTLKVSKGGVMILAK